MADSRTVIATSALAVAFCAGPVALAQSARDEAADAAIACLDIGDPAERLACLEEATREIKATRIRQETAEEASAAEASGGVIAAENATGDELFGAEALRSIKRARQQKDRAARLDANVAGIRVGPLKNVTVTLGNGQVWRQLEGDRTVIRPRERESGYTVTITKGAFGNYWMKINEIDRMIRVKRIK